MCLTCVEVVQFYEVAVEEVGLDCYLLGELAEHARGVLPDNRFLGEQHLGIVLLHQKNK
jgi:hypothetical protein